MKAPHSISFAPNRVQMRGTVMAKEIGIPFTIKIGFCLTRRAMKK
jgi:hypothetical protein